MALTSIHVNDVCRLGQGTDCCRYLLLGRDGWECGKLTPIAASIDLQVLDGHMKSAGDNCDGIK